MNDAQPRSVRLTPHKVRHLSVQDLDLNAPAALIPTPDAPELQALDPDDPILAAVRDLLQFWGGIILVGPPGTSKSWYAARLAFSLTDGDQARIRFVQFHPSYQYEDFIEGFIPEEGGGFKLAPKHLLELCKIARDGSNIPVVLVIDELSRGDPARIFGEALTYLEKSKRGLRFHLASGTECHIPSNLIVLATMNPLDRGVDEVDAALDRRFGKLAMDPDEGILARVLAESGMKDELRARVLFFFREVNSRRRSNPFAALGHTYFIGVADVVGLHRVWQHQLRFHFDKAYRLDPDGRAELDRLWNQVLGVAGDLSGTQPSDTEISYASTEEV